MAATMPPCQPTTAHSTGPTSRTRPPRIRPVFIQLWISPRIRIRFAIIGLACVIFGSCLPDRGRGGHRTKLYLVGSGHAFWDSPAGGQLPLDSEARSKLIRCLAEQALTGWLGLHKKT